MHSKGLRSFGIVTLLFWVVSAVWSNHAYAISITQTFKNQPRTITVFDFGSPKASPPTVTVSYVWCWEDGGTPGCFSGTATVAVGFTGLVFSNLKDDGGNGTPGPNCVYYTGNPGAYDYCMDIMSSTWDGQQLTLDWEGITDRYLNDVFGQPFMTSITAEIPTCTGPVAISWTDPVITPNVTKIRKIHLDELRAWIDNRRVDAGLTGYPWTDPVISPNVTKVRKVHFDELRATIAEVYTACGQVPPGWTDNLITANTTRIRRVHLDELRNATANAP